MRQTVNPVHLLQNNNRLHKQIVWAPCGYDGGRLGRVKIVTLREGEGRKNTEEEWLSCYTYK